MMTASYPLAQPLSWRTTPRRQSATANSIDLQLLAKTKRYHIHPVSEDAPWRMRQAGIDKNLIGTEGNPTWRDLAIDG
jgi:hypothetical protein